MLAFLIGWLAIMTVVFSFALERHRQAHEGSRPGWFSLVAVPLGACLLLFGGAALLDWLVEPDPAGPWSALLAYLAFGWLLFLGARHPSSKTPRRHRARGDA